MEKDSGHFRESILVDKTRNSSLGREERDVLPSNARVFEEGDDDDDDDEEIPENVTEKLMQ